VWRDISPYFIRLAAKFIAAYPIYVLINHGFELRIFPDELKIVPMFKTGSQQNPSNYHPISLLSCFLKSI